MEGGRIALDADIKSVAQVPFHGIAAASAVDPPPETQLWICMTNPIRIALITAAPAVLLLAKHGGAAAIVCEPRSAMLFSTAGLGASLWSRSDRVRLGCPFPHAFSRAGS